MKPFSAQDLWDMIENGYQEPSPLGSSSSHSSHTEE